MDQALRSDVDFGELPAAIDALLQQGVLAYRSDRMRAESLFGQALAIDPSQLATYFCLYKIHAYRGDLDAALQAARAGLAEGARQAGWPADWRGWPRPATPAEGAARFALFTLKALAFIHLRREERDSAHAALEALAALDPQGLVGWPVIAALAEGAA